MELSPKVIKRVGAGVAGAAALIGAHTIANNAPEPAPEPTTTTEAPTTTIGPGIELHTEQGPTATQVTSEAGSDDTGSTTTEPGVDVVTDEGVPTATQLTPEQNDN